MLCPKCGQEYMGDSCPRCDGPKIIVNNQDYLKRKMEYEKKQAGVESASSSSGFDSGKEENKKGVKFLTQDDVRPDEVFKKLLERAKQGGSDTSEANGDNAVKKRNRFKLVKRIIIAVAAIVALIAGTVAVIRIIEKNSQILYTRYNGKIYNVSGIDSAYVCDYADAYFTYDEKSFYTPDEPSDIVGKDITLKLSSENGKYFVSESYDEATQSYSLLLWNSTAEYILSENGSKKSVLYLADDGTVVFQETEMINDVGGMGKSKLFISRLTKSDSGVTPVTTQLSDNVRHSFVYSDEQLIVYNSEDDNLYSYSFGKNKTETLISEDVSAVYPMYAGNSGYYSYKAGQLNTDKDVSTFVYISNGKAYLYDCLEKDATGIAIDSATSVTGEYIVMDGSGIYAVTSSQVRFASYKNKQVGAYETVMQLGNTSNLLYFSDRDMLVCVSSDGKLKSVSRGVAKDIAENVSEGSLSAVGNTDYGVVYVRSNVLCYMNVLTGSEIIISEAGSSVSTSDTLMYKKHIYYYNAAGKLCYCTSKGNDNKLIGDVEKFWLGK